MILQQIQSLEEENKRLKENLKNTIYKLDYMVSVWDELNIRTVDISRATGIVEKTICTARQGCGKNYDTVLKLHYFTEKILKGRR